MAFAVPATLFFGTRVAPARQLRARPAAPTAPGVLASSERRDPPRPSRGHKDAAQVSPGRRRCLLVVDIQNDFCEGGALAVPRASEIIEPVNRLRAEKRWNVVVLSQDWHPAGHASFASTHGRKPFEQMRLRTGMQQILWPDHCVQNTRGAEFHPALKRAEGDRVVQKGTDMEIDSYSAFYDNARQRSTGLTDILKEEGITDVYVCGLATDHCVAATALDAVGDDFATFLIEDASRGIDPDGVARKLEACRARGVAVVSSDEIPES